MTPEEKIKKVMDENGMNIYDACDLTKILYCDLLTTKLISLESAIKEIWELIGKIKETDSIKMKHLLGGEDEGNS